MTLLLVCMAASARAQFAVSSASLTPLMDGSQPALVGGVPICYLKVTCTGLTSAEDSVTYQSTDPNSTLLFAVSSLTSFAPSNFEQDFTLDDGNTLPTYTTVSFDGTVLSLQVASAVPQGSYLLSVTASDVSGNPVADTTTAVSDLPIGADVMASATNDLLHWLLVILGAVIGVVAAFSGARLFLAWINMRAKSC